MGTPFHEDGEEDNYRFIKDRDSWESRDSQAGAVDMTATESFAFDGKTTRKGKKTGAGFTLKRAEAAYVDMDEELAAKKKRTEKEKA